jgi:hypothetical protein
MNIRAVDNRRIELQLTPGDASRLLHGLESMRDELGDVAEELISLLRGYGVSSMNKPDRPRKRGYAESQ